MPAFADEYKKQQPRTNEAPSMDTHHEPTRSPSNEKASMPSDAVLTNWLAKDDVCSGENAPVICTKPEPVPAPLTEPVPINRSVAPPKPTDWGALTPSLATCPTEVINGEPAFKPAYASENLEPYKLAFSSDWSDVKASYNALVSLHRSYKDKEKDVIPLLQLDSSAYVGPNVQDLDAGKSFVGGQLRPSLTGVESSKLAPELRKQIFDTQDRIKISELDVASKRDLVTNANDSLLQAVNVVDIAVNKIDIVKTDAKVENLQLDKEQVRRDLENFKAKAKAAVESIKAVTSVLNVFSDPTKTFGNVLGAVGQSATASGAIAEAGQTVKANAKLAEIDGHIRELKDYKAGLLGESAEKELHNALLEVDKKHKEAKVATRALETAKVSYGNAYREMGVLMEKAGAASGLNAKNRKSLAAAVEAVPKIEVIQQQLQGMEEGLAPPTYSEASGVGASMVSNLGVFTRAVAVVKGNREYVAELRALWDARRASVTAVVDQAVSGGDQ